MTFNSTVGDYSYPGATGVHPHAVAQVDDGSGNIIPTFSYDPHGNMMSDGTHSLNYDGETARSVNVSGVRYVLGRDGKLLKKKPDTHSIPSPAAATRAA